MIKSIFGSLSAFVRGKRKPDNGYGPLVRFGRETKVVGKVDIGDYTYIGDNTVLGPNCKAIGKYCSIGPNCWLGPNNHPQDKLSTSAVFYSKSWGLAKNPNKHLYNDQKVVVENDVWFGVNVVVSGNVTISTGAIVAANAVVTKDVPPYAIVGGVPAKVIGYRFDEKTRKELLAGKWWELEVEDAIKLYEQFNPGA